MKCLTESKVTLLIFCTSVKGSHPFLHIPAALCLASWHYFVTQVAARSGEWRGEIETSNASRDAGWSAKKKKHKGGRRRGKWFQARNYCLFLSECRARQRGKQKSLCPLSRHRQWRRKYRKMHLYQCSYLLSTAGIWSSTTWCWTPRATSRLLTLACVRRTCMKAWPHAPSAAPQTTSHQRWEWDVQQQKTKVWLCILFFRLSCPLCAGWEYSDCSLNSDPEQIVPDDSFALRLSVNHTRIGYLAQQLLLTPDGRVRS